MVDSLNSFFLPNVKEHAPLSAGACVCYGVEVQTTEQHVNRAADRSCCVSTCSALLSFYNEDSELVDEWKVASKMLTTANGLETLIGRILQTTHLRGCLLRIRPNELERVGKGKVHFFLGSGKRVEFDKLQ